MAHLVLNPRISARKLKSLYKEYSEKRDNAEDTFEKAEYEGFLGTILEFCMLRGGYKYINLITNDND